jgi:hypothetical protein
MIEGHVLFCLGEAEGGDVMRESRESRPKPQNGSTNQMITIVTNAAQ